jgi:hypothetical protein
MNGAFNNSASNPSGHGISFTINAAGLKMMNAMDITKKMEKDGPLEDLSSVEVTNPDKLLFG